MTELLTSRRAVLRQCAVYAAITFVPAFALAVGLALSFRAIAQRHGLAQGRAEASLLAETAVEPELDQAPLSAGLTAREQAAFTRLVRRAVQEGDVLRLRLRGLDGRVVFSDDGSGFGDKPED